jgi:uncharacterized circularly permuted ATP-grasp superfamily protein/uncharacterized alpha-E superfamily protein
MSATHVDPAFTGNVFADYRPLPGVRDEAVTADGQPRAHWQQFSGRLAAMGPQIIEERRAYADQYMREAGVSYRFYDQSQASRPFPLSHIPVILPEDEWTTLSEGLIERAELLETIAADIYGRATLVRDGLLPAALLAGNREFLRPLVGVRPQSGSFLQFYAADLGRGPDGQWWVLSDRTQAPSGAGYALENRVAVSRAFPDAFRDIEVNRLAGFFQVFRDALSALTPDYGSRVGVLTPGPHNETYFEHVYLARYLGFLLLEGGDLVVRDGRVMVSTVSGPIPIDVLWRRFDSDYLDPLELDATSRIGVPGLVQAVRSGALSVVNALGTGVLESRALMGFLPQLMQKLYGRDLQLPHIATWWCGQESERAHVLDHLDRLAVAPAMPGVDLAEGNLAVPAASLPEDERIAVEKMIASRGDLVVGQELVQLSTTPSWEDGRLVPRPFVVRAYLARGADGWSVMPGGFCRVADRSEPNGIDTRAISMQSGGRAADIWVISDGPIPPVSLLPQDGERYVRRLASTLPSRSAESLFWLGRYVERAEMLLRLFRAHAVRASEVNAHSNPALEAIETALAEYGIEEGRTIHDRLVETIGQAEAAVSSIRDRFSPDAWRTLRTLLEALEGAEPGFEISNRGIQAITDVLTRLAAFSGLAQENMYRLASWHYLEAGRRIERGILIARSAMALRVDDPPFGTLDAMLEISDSLMTHRRRYAVSLSVASVIDLVVLDPNNPRSVAFQVHALSDHLVEMPGRNPGEPLTALERAVLKLKTDLETAVPDDAGSDFLGDVSARLSDISDKLARTYFRTGTSLVDNVDALAGERY